MVKVVTYWSTLFAYARQMAEAEKSGTLEEYARAKARHDDYAAACLKADEIR